MKAVIRFTRPDNKLAILTEFLDIIQGVSQLRQHVLTHGILFEPLSKDEVEVLRNALINLKYAEYITGDHSLRLMIERGELHGLLKLVTTLPFMRNEFAEMFWEKGFTIDNLTANQAFDFQKRLEAIATVNIIPDKPESPQILTHTVSGQVRWSDNTPHTESGHTVRAYDNLALLGESALSQLDGTFKINYPWQPGCGRNGPNLIVQVFNVQGEVVAETRQSPALAEETVNLVVQKLESRTFILTGIVKHQTTEDISPEQRESTAGLRVEVWDKYQILNSPLVSTVTDQNSIFQMTLDEHQIQKVFVGLRPDVFFKVHAADRLLFDSRDVLIHNLNERTREVIIEIPAVQKPTEPEQQLSVIQGITVLSPGWQNGVLIEAFADAGLRQPLGMANTDHCGHFEIQPSLPPEQIWFRWTQGQKQGQSPILQPYNTSEPIRLHIFDRYPDIQNEGTGKGNYHGTVHSTSGRPVNGMALYLREIALRRCQTLGVTISDQNGTYQMTYDLDALFADEPDLRVLIQGSEGVPLLESTTANVILPGQVAETTSLFQRVADVLHSEGITGAADCQLTQSDVDYLVKRTNLSGKAIVAYTAASALATELKIPSAALFALFNSDGIVDPGMALEQAVERDDISPSVLRRLPEIKTAVLTAAREHITKKDLGRGSIDELLALQIQDASIRNEVAALMLEAPSSAELRDKLAERGILSPGLDFLLKVQNITGVDVPLARTLSRALNEGKITSDPLSLSTAQWFEMLKESGVHNEGEVIEEEPSTVKLKANARRLKLRAERHDPTQAFRNQVAQHSKNSWAIEISHYLAKHPEFDFNAPVAIADIQSTPELATVAAFKRVESIVKVHDIAGALMVHGLSSARAIAQIGPGELQRVLSGELDGDNQTAVEIHERALKKSAAVNIASSYLPLGVKHSLCGCPQCKSIFGPAAYLFELLLFLNRYNLSRANGGITLLKHFEPLRPDVPRVRLSCANTNIEVPHIDLVNELLEDLILEPSGNAVGRGLEKGECLPSIRETQGTSEERRAFPQNEPSEMALNLLTDASFPWSLPYDFHRDRAGSARAALISKPEDVALAVWRYQSTAQESSIETATAALAWSLLDLGKRESKQVDLILNPSTLEAAWGSQIAADVMGSQHVRLLDLKRVTGLDYETLEAVLDTWFVRGEGSEDNLLRFDPDDPCQADEEGLLLMATFEYLAGLLDRVHRFERLRRHLGWSVSALDEALRWLDGPLDAQRLEQIGLLRFLELKLDVVPERVLALLRNPDILYLPTLRSRRVVSSFEKLFGASAHRLNIPDDDLVTAAERARFVSARIAAVAREPLATVDLIFSKGLVAPVQSVEALVALTDADLQDAYRQAVCATYRLAQWSSCLRLDEAECIDLIVLADLSILPRGTDSVDPARQLQDSLRLVDWVDQKRDWPVSISELRYLASDDPSAMRQHGLNATEIGRMLEELRQELKSELEAQKPLPVDAQAAVRALLSRLLLMVAPVEPAATEAKVQELAHQLEWSAFFPDLDLAARASEVLSQTLPEWPGVDALIVSPTPAGGMDEALASLDRFLQNWLTQHFAGLSEREPAPWSDASYTTLIFSLGATATQMLQGLDIDDSVVKNDLESFLAATLDPSRTATVTITKQLLANAVEHVSAQLALQLQNHAANLLPLLQTTAHRMIGRKVLIDWIARTRAVQESTAETLLDRLNNPHNAAESIVRAFIDSDGAMTPDLEMSVVTARYLEVTETVTSLTEIGGRRIQQAQSRLETTLAFDWSVHATLPGLQEKRFAAVMEVTIPAAHLFEQGDPVALAVETDGQVLVEIQVGNDRQQLVNFDADGTVTRYVREAAAYRDLLDRAQQVVLHIRYLSPPAKRFRTFKLLKRSSDGQYDEFHWALLAEAVQRLTRMALALRDGTIPPAAWRVLHDVAVPARAVDLNQLAAGAALTHWLRVFALQYLAKRVRARQDIQAWLALLAGTPVARRDVLRVWNLEETALTGVLELLSIDSTTDTIALPATLRLEQITAVLRLADLARRFGLPVPALARWSNATAAEIYQWSLAALSRGLEPSERLKLLAAVYDPVREHLRDAQLDYLIGRARESGEPFGSREDLSDHLLIDVQMSPCMVTSRIQFSYAAVQKYVDLALSGRLSDSAPAEEERFAREWVRFRHYRLWEAEIRIRLTPENWIEPEIRPTKTPIWEKFAQRLQSEPLTLHLAEQALREYTASLAEVAHLETIAIVTHEQPDLERPVAFRDTELTGTHVFARTRAHPRRLYYRRRLPKPDGRWMPWELVDWDPEGSHFLAVIAFGRVRLMCADFAVARELRINSCDSSNKVNRSIAVAGNTIATNYEVNLSWIDREHGKWSPVRRSGSYPFTISPTNAPDRDYLWTKLPQSQYPEIQRVSQYVLDSVSVSLSFHPDDMEYGSKMRIELFDEDEQRHHFVGDVKHEEKPPHAVKPATRPLGTINAAKLSRVRLEWYPKTKEDGHTDDCNVNSIGVHFMRGERIEHSSWVVSGFSNVKMAESEISEDYPDKEGWFTPDYPWRFQGGHFEKAIRAFEGKLWPPLNLGKRLPQLTDFDIEYEVDPQSVDLEKSLRIEAANFNNDSFEIHIHSLTSSTTMVQSRARFKVKESVFTEILPEAKGNWPEGWVTGSEFCFPYHTAAGPLSSLHIYADDAVQLGNKPSIRANDHPGTSSMGQKMVSYNTNTNFPPLLINIITGRFWSSLSPRIYGGEQALASPKLNYELVVQRDRPISGESSPKIIEESALPTQAPARMFFMERVGEVPLVEAEAVFVLDPRPMRIAPQKNAQIKKLQLSAWQSEISLPSTGAAFLPAITIPSRDMPAITLPAGVMDLIQESARPYGNITNIPPNILADARQNLTLHQYQSVWSIQTFWHPQAVGFRRILEARGLPRLLRLANQELSTGTDLVAEQQRVDFFSRYSPTSLVSQPWPRDAVDFTIDGPFSEYNWELFHDSLVYLTKVFDADGKFDLSDEIFPLMIDVTKAGNPGAWEKDSTLYRIAPIRYSIELDVELTNNGLSGLTEGGQLRQAVIDQIARINQNPYQPHIIARGWPSIYGRALRLRFADHLIRAGEHHFRRAYQGDNRTDLELANTRFDFAARVLGQPQDTLGPVEGDSMPCFAALMIGRDGSATRDVDILESYLPGNVLSGQILSDESASGAQVYFCVPHDEKLDELRVLVADRLAKLRSCQDIDGVRRALSLYGQRIDPALLVRATAEGLDLDVVLGQISSAKPTMYFSALWSRAVQACERARTLEEAWLGARERADAEGYALLQNEQEISSLEMQVEQGVHRLEDARLLVEALDRTIESAQLRYDFYSTRERITALEKAESELLAKASAADARAAADSRTASDWTHVPTAEIFAEAGTGSETKGWYTRAGASLRYRVGGETAVQAYRAFSEGHRNDSAGYRAQAGLTGQSAARQIRSDHDKFNASLAQKDIAKGDRDKAGALVRVEIADLELQLQRKRVEDAKALRTYMRDKFTNQQLYSWRASRLEQLRYQQHRIAYDLAVQAKAALARELGLEDQGFLSDTGHGSSCAAAGLLVELEKMQHTHVTARRSERKKTKSYSLATRQPLAFLELLQRGETIFTISEHEYDEDAAGDWFRTFSHVAITVPAVRGPYTNVNVELTQLRGEIRRIPHNTSDAGSYPRSEIEDDRFKSDLTTGERIATNTGMQDDGTVDRKEDPETPPPFARNGAIATFRIELRPELNHFDRLTIPDVVLDLTINSRYGGESACQAGEEARRAWLADNPVPFMIPLHSAFSSAWHQFVNRLSSEDGSELALKIDESHIPLHLLPVNRIVQTNLYFAYPDDHDDLTVVGGGIVGEFSRPNESELTKGGPLPLMSIRRLKLRQPFHLGMERKIHFAQNTATPKYGWLVCWVEGRRN